MAHNNPPEVKRVLEAALLTAQKALSTAELCKMFEDDLSLSTIHRLLNELQQEYSLRPLELLEIASGWRFKSRAEYAPYLQRLNPERAPKYSRAVLETLAIVAYKQPVTRGDIEEIRGVSVAAQVISTLEDRGWIEEIGRRESPGRPVLFATTRRFLDDLGLQSISELPPLHEMQQNLELIHA